MTFIESDRGRRRLDVLTRKGGGSKNPRDLMAELRSEKAWPLYDRGLSEYIHSFGPLWTPPSLDTGDLIIDLAGTGGPTRELQLAHPDLQLKGLAVSIADARPESSLSHDFRHDNIYRAGDLRQPRTWQGIYALASKQRLQGASLIFFRPIGGIVSIVDEQDLSFSRAQLELAIGLLTTGGTFYGQIMPRQYDALLRNIDKNHGKMSIDDRQYELSVDDGPTKLSLPILRVERADS